MSLIQGPGVTEVELELVPEERISREQSVDELVSITDRGQGYTIEYFLCSRED